MTAVRALIERLAARRTWLRVPGDGGPDRDCVAAAAALKVAVEALEKSHAAFDAAESNVRVFGQSDPMLLVALRASERQSAAAMREIERLAGEQP